MRALDKSFGVRGKVRTAFPSENAAATAVAIQPNGKVIVAGPTGATATAQRRIAVARYMPDGTLDSTFGRGGKVMSPLEATSIGVFLGAALALQPNGKIVVAGTTDSTYSGSSRFAVARYNANGSLDSSFGNKGEATAAFGTDWAAAMAIALEPDGKIVVAGYTLSGASFALQGFALARYNADGSLDSTFGSGGEVTTVVGSAAAAAAVAVQSNGKILAAGSTSSGKDLQVRHFALVRYNGSGVLDPTFGRDGIVTTTFRNDDAIQGLAISPDGRTVAVGSTVSHRGAYFRFALARYEPDGSLDSSFGSGKVTTAFGPGDDQAHAVTTSQTARSSWLARVPIRRLMRMSLQLPDTSIERSARYRVSNTCGSQRQSTSSFGPIARSGNFEGRSLQRSEEGT